MIKTKKIAISLPAEVLQAVEKERAESGESRSQLFRRAVETGFVPQHTGDNQKVEFLLYKNGEAVPEDTLHLWVNVKEQ